MTEPKKPKEKAVLMTIGNVRIVEYDASNVTVERLEESKNNGTEEPLGKWRFKGYSGTIQSALRMIVHKELLIDKSAVSDLESYIEQVEKSNTVILGVIG